MKEEMARMDVRMQQLVHVREAAWACLEGESPDFDVSAAQAQVDAMALSDVEKEQPAFLEVKILLILASDRPAKRAGKALYYLFRERTALSEGEVFEQFQNRVKALADRGVSLGELPFVVHFGNIDHGPVWTSIGEAIRQVSDLIGPVFLNSGTLLGVVRERGLLLHDDDVDLGLVLNAETAEAAAREWAQVYHLLHENGLLEKKVARNYGVFKLIQGGDLNIDLFPAWIEDDRVWLYPHSAGTMHRDQLLPLAVCPHSRQPIPRDSGAMLASNYGEKWREPDPGYKFRWNRANRKFERFREALVADMSIWKL